MIANKRHPKKLFIVVLMTVFLFLGSTNLWADCPIDEEYKEAMKQTEDEWKAFRETLQQGSAKLEELESKYKEYKEIAFAGDTERAVNLAIDLFKLDRKNAKAQLQKVREMFNSLDKAGLADKLSTVAEKLKVADSYAGEVDNVWQFAKKFDPSNAKNNPTYGLRLIGDILKESGEKFEKVPVVGETLGKYVRMLGDAAVDYAGALDRVSKTIRENARQGALCAQHGLFQEEQAAFFKAVKSDPHYTGAPCSQYFPSMNFPSLQGATFHEGSGTYYFFSPKTCRGYFAPVSNTDKIYRWWKLLKKKFALYPDWLASRANSLNSDNEQRAELIFSKFEGWTSQIDPEWVMIDKLGLLGDVSDFQEDGHDVFIANYMLNDDYHSDAESIMSEYEKHCYISGTVKVETPEGDKPADNARVEAVLGGATYTESTNSSGQFEILMEGDPNSAFSITASVDEYTPDTRSASRMASRVIVGEGFTLRKEALSFTVSGTVFNSSKEPAEPVNGATISASGFGTDEPLELGTGVSGADGSYSLTITAEMNTSINVSASKDGASSSIRVVASGESFSGQDIYIAVEDTTADTTKVAGKWTVNVNVVDINGVGIPSATVSGALSGAVTTDAAGSAVIGPMTIPDTAAAYSITLTATVITSNGEPTGGDATEVIYEGAPASAVTLTIPVEMPIEVTISGRVADANGVGVEGASVDCSGMTAVTQAGGGFSLGPVVMTKGEQVTVNATLTTPDTTFSGSASAVFDGVGKSISGVEIVMEIETQTEVSVSGRVLDADGLAIEGAAVSAGGQSSVTDGSGGFSLSGIRHVLGMPLAINATVVTYDGGTQSASETVTPETEQVGGVTLVVQVESVDADSIDALIDELEDDIDDSGTDYTNLLADFNATVGDLDFIAAEFGSYADFFEQRLRDLREASCESGDVAYALAGADVAADDYSIMLSVATTLWTEIAAARATNPDAAELTLADAEYTRVSSQGDAIQGRYASMLSQYDVYGCDKDEDDADTDQSAEDDANPEDYETGVVEGGGVEICGDNIDNDGDGEIDECDAGCCDKNVQVTVDDCGTADDDIFIVYIDEAKVGVTPKGKANTFNRELSPGDHTVRVQCVDDGSVPPGNDIGTACVNIVIYGTQAQIGGGEMSIPYGSSQTVSFNVPESNDVPGFIWQYDGGSLAPERPGGSN